eukprot:COSAG05_NODE_7_length_42457_cov_58.929152_34_plen_113_part_00
MCTFGATPLRWRGKKEAARDSTRASAELLLPIAARAAARIARTRRRQPAARAAPPAPRPLLLHGPTARRPAQILPTRSESGWLRDQQLKHADLGPTVKTEFCEFSCMRAFCL